jgi:iron complex outermembrane recepter protein
MTKARTAVVIHITGCCALALTGALRAQTGSSVSPSQPTSEIEEIVVIAQKREQRSEDVGITIVSAGAQQLHELGVSDVSQLNQVVSGFTATTDFTGFPIFSLRGINFTGSQLSAPPAVSVYLDEAPLPYSVMTGGILLDVERVEVLKGPQGTLFGENSTGGSINVIAAKPTDGFAAGTRAEVNNFGQTTVEGYVSGPITGTLRARFAATTTQFGAWQEGYYLNDQKNGDQNKAGARLLLDWTPVDQLKVALNLNGNYDHGQAQQTQLFLVSPANPAAVVPGLIGYRLPSSDRDADFDLGFNTHVKNTLSQAVLRADYEFDGNLTLTSLTDYVSSKTEIPIDLDGTALSIISASYGGELRTTSQEFRLAGMVPSASIYYLVGVNYEYDTADEEQPTEFPGYSGLPPGSFLNPAYDTTNRAGAAFGNIDYKVTPLVTLSAGTRLTETKQTIRGCTIGNGVSNALAESVANVFRGLAGLPATGAFAPGGCFTINDTGANPQYLPASPDLEQRQHNVSWHTGINFKPTPDSLIYGLVSRGYKSGVFPVEISLFQATANQPVSQEELTSYEVGVKLPLFSRRVQFNLASFYYDYKNKQFYTYVPIPPIGAFSTLVNIPRSNVKGADLDVTAKPIDSLMLRTALTYIDSHTGNYSGFNLNSQPVNFSGKQFNFAPPVSATFDAEYQAPVGKGLRAFIGGGAVYNNRTYSDLGESPTALIPAYAILSARLGLRSESGWTAGLWIRNLTNRYYWTDVVSNGDTFNRMAGFPRTFGVAVSDTF